MDPTSIFLGKRVGMRPRLTINQQLHSDIQVSASYVCVHRTFVAAGVFGGHVEERQAVFLPKRQRRRDAVHEGLLVALAPTDQPLFAALVDL